jgi:hypothetical protein
MRYGAKRGGTHCGHCLWLLTPASDERAVGEKRGKKAVVSMRGCLISTVVLQRSDRTK